MQTDNTNALQLIVGVLHIIPFPYLPRVLDGKFSTLREILIYY
jgi:hypothetical protein